MKRRISGLLAIAAFVIAGVLGSVQSLAQNAYITNENNIESVIDTTTNTVTATIPVGSLPFGVAVSPDGSTVYVANFAALRGATGPVRQYRLLDWPGRAGDRGRQ